MANLWLRLYHDMPNDPKWRTIARVSQQPIPLVLAVYLHLLVIASQATDRGAVVNINTEDIASALDGDSVAIDAVIVAMQGRVIESDRLSGWDKRQVSREDSSAERVKKYRERNVTQCNAEKRNVTLDKSREEEIKNKKQVPSDAPSGARTAKAKIPDPRHSEFKESFGRYFAHLNHGLVAPWDEQEGAQLARFLKKNPQFTTEHWKTLLQNRARSDVTHAENLSTWITRALTWANEPTKRGVFNGKPVIADGLSAKQAVLDARRARRMADESHHDSGENQAGIARLGDGSERTTPGLVC